MARWICGRCRLQCNSSYNAFGIQAINATERTQSKSETQVNVDPESVKLEPILKDEANSNDDEYIPYTAPTRKQDEISSEIEELHEKIAKFSVLKNAGMLNSEDSKKLKLFSSTLTDKKLKLKRLKAEATRQRLRRSELQARLQKLAETDPSINKFTRSKVGRPSLNVDQPELLRVICDIASAGASADDRRRTEQLRSCKTLDDLTKAVNDAGFHLRRSATYLRLQPRRSNSTQGKHHVTFWTLLSTQMSK